MSGIFREILEETLRFRAVIPDLLRDHAGQWVVFKDGRVFSFHPSEEDACLAGLRRFGSQTYVVDRVEVKRPEPVTAAFVYA